MRHSDFRVLLKYTGHQAITADIIYTLQRQTERRGRYVMRELSERMTLREGKSENICLFVRPT